jgi:hypothetical protein
LIFVGRGGNFEFLRGLQHVGLFLGNGKMAEKLPVIIDNLIFEVGLK